jgi:surfeit locus 1 family protein
MSRTARRITMAGMLLAAAGFARLGVWQLSRLHQRQAANRITLAARAAPPATLAADQQRADTLAQHRVVAVGRYDPAHELVLRGAILDGTPGVHLVTPLLLGDRGPAVLVDRGFLPAPDAVTVDTRGAREPGRVTVRGLALPFDRAPGEPVTNGGHTTWRRLNLEELEARSPYPLLPIYIQQAPDSGLSSFPRRIEPEPIDEGPHLSYAIQWFLFAVMAVAFAILIVGRDPGGSER